MTDYQKGYQDGYKDAKEEQPQGEWNRIDYPLKAKRNVIIYTCNLCGEISDSNKYNFCPNCGAKMKQG